MGVRSGFGPLQEPGSILCCSHTNCLLEVVGQTRRKRRKVYGREKEEKEGREENGRRGMEIRKEGQSLDEREKLIYR